ncbi:MAG TPA: PhzF family phenazine biosynthesis isomerase, partial [Thalassobaculum sp.]
MRVPIYQVDSFTSRRFSGNPAAVVLFHDFPDDTRLQAIAAENNLAETAFLAPHDDGWALRWFTPTVEVPLCGHATLASAWVILVALHPDRAEVRFSTRYSGDLVVRRAGERFVMDFPANPPVPIAPPPGLAARGSQDHPQIPGNPKAGIPLPRITERDLLEAGAVDDVAAAGVQMAGHHRMRPVPDVPVLGGGGAAPRREAGHPRDA